MNVLIFLSVVNTYTVGIRPLFCSDLPVAFDPCYLHHSRVLLIHHAWCRQLCGTKRQYTWSKHARARCSGNKVFYFSVPHLLFCIEIFFFSSRVIFLCAVYLLILPLLTSPQCGRQDVKIRCLAKPTYSSSSSSWQSAFCCLSGVPIVLRSCCLCAGNVRIMLSVWLLCSDPVVCVCMSDHIGVTEISSLT